MLAALLALALTLPTTTRVQDSAAENADAQAAPAFDWVEGPGVGQLGDRAHVEVPAGFRFTGGEGTRILMAAMENPTSGNELGLLVNESEEEGRSWFVVFEFSDSGYVKDDERDSLDADALMETMRAGNEAGNRERERRGWETIELVGWQREPFYDPRTNNLTWATLGRSQNGGESVNWSVRVLGREGVMNIDLVLAPEGLDAALPEFEKVIDSFQYEDGQRYAQFTSGDKIAEYGLAALVVGGGAAIAAKTGLLTKLLKPLLVALAAIAAFAKKIWSWMTGRSRDTAREGETS